MLELAPPEEGVPQEATADTPFEPDETGDRDEPVSAPDSAELTKSDTLASEASGPLDASYENVYDGEMPAVAPAPAQLGEAGPVSYGAGGRSDFEDSDSLEGTLTRPKSLREHVEEQIALDATAPIDRHICAYLMDQVDDTGYFTGDTAEVAEILGCEVGQVENAWGCSKAATRWGFLPGRWRSASSCNSRIADAVRSKWNYWSIIWRCSRRATSPN